ncbi:MAG: hypothetical protein AAB784_03450 [Patescibacteria group bacterium]
MNFNLELANGIKVLTFKSPKFDAKDADPMGIGVIMDIDGGKSNVERQFAKWKASEKPKIFAVIRGIVDIGDYVGGEHYAWLQAIYCMQ